MLGQWGSSLTCLNCPAPLVLSTWYRLGSPLTPPAPWYPKLEGGFQDEAAFIEKLLGSECFHAGSYSLRWV